MSKVFTNKDLSSVFIMTIQFSKTDMSLTTNEGTMDITNMRMHGMALAENHDQLGEKDHEALQALCRSYLEECGYYVR